MDKPVEIPYKIRRLGAAADVVADVASRKGQLWLHCGCGTVMHRGWINSDAVTYVGSDGTSTTPGDICVINERLAYLQHDASQPFPLADQSISRVYSEHFIEHLNQDAAVAWLADMYRILTPGGLMRVSTPDLAQYVRGYLDARQELLSTWHADLLKHGASADLPKRRAFLFNVLFRSWGHRYIYDHEEIVHALVQAGWSREWITGYDFRQGSVASVAALDQDWRRAGSLYVEAVKGPA